MMKSLIFIGAAVWLAAGTASAQLILYEDMAGTPGQHAVDGAGLSGTNGWSGGYAGATPELVSGTLSYPGLAAAGGHKALTRNAAETNRGTAYLYFNEVTNGSLYVSFLMRADDVSSLATNATTAFFSLRWPFGGNIMTIRHTASGDYQIGAAAQENDPQDTVWSSGIETGQTVLVVAGCDAVETSSETGWNLWINPHPETLGGSPPPVTFQSGWRNGGTRMLSFGSDQYDLDADVYYDEVRLGGSFADVTPTGTRTVCGTGILID